MVEQIFKALVTVWLWLCGYFNFIHLVFNSRRSGYSRRKPEPATTSSSVRRPPKPKWVRKEVIRLKALMVHDGCRKISDTFNRLHRNKKNMTVGKTYVHETIKKHEYEIRILRKKIKNKKPRPLPKNLIWSLDLTQVADATRQPHTLFGLIDAGTRACLSLQHVRTKAAITLLRCLLDSIERYGMPKIIRTDNEAVFISRIFRFGLWLLGIHHQRTEKCCPWMNGRIERLFGTLKAKLQHHVTENIETLKEDLSTFRLWYNHVRTHQYLNGKTPAETWNRQQPNPKGKHVYFRAWDGGLTGFYLPPS